jgi:hypothetical protein
MLESTPDLLHRLFIHNASHLPLTAELFRYVRNNNVYDLKLRCSIARTNEGSVYLGIREIPTPHDTEGSPFAVVISWDVATGAFTVRDRATGGQSVTSAVLANNFRPVVLDMARPPQRHLGYSIYFVKDADGILYCPALELAIIDQRSVAGQEYKEIVGSVKRGEPDLLQFDILRHC